MSKTIGRGGKPRAVDPDGKDVGYQPSAPIKR